MYFNKIFKSGHKSEEGFVLVIALFAMLLLIAAGAYALNMTTNDLSLSVKMVAERRAFAASESCWNIFAATYNPSTYDPNALAVTDNYAIDNADPSLTCSTTRQTTPSIPTAVPSGYETSGGVTWVYLTWMLTVDGYDTSYGGHQQSQSSVGFGPVMASTEYK
jgi:hypothetical protein